MEFTKKYSKRARKNLWGFDCTINGLRIRRWEWNQKRQAREAYAKLIDYARRERYGLDLPQPHATLGKLQAKLDSSLTKHQRATFESFVELFGEAQALASIKRSHLVEFRGHLASRDLKDSSINTYMDYVCTLLRRAGDFWPGLEWEPRRLPRLRTKSGRTRVLHAEEIARLCAQFRADKIPREHGQRSVRTRKAVFDFFRVGLLTGTREGELLALSEKGINADWRTIRVYRQKTKTESVLPWSSTVETILRSRKPGAGGRFFADLTVVKLSYTLRRVAAAASVEYGQNAEGGWVIHSLRHTAATMLEELGVSRSTVAAILGHSGGGMTGHYVHPSLSAQRAAMEKLEAWCNAIAGFNDVPAESEAGQESRNLMTGF